MLILARTIDDPRYKYRRVPKAQAMVWSRDDSDAAKAKEYADKEGYTLYVLPFTEDVLQVAKDRILSEQAAEAQTT